MIVPYRRRKRPYVLPVVAVVAVAAPLATAYAVHQPDGYRPANENGIAAVPARMAEVALAAAPDVTLPLRELTGLNLPDLHLSDLRALPLPTAIPVPGGLQSLVPGMVLPNEIPLPQFDRGTTPTQGFAPTTTPIAPQGFAPTTTPISPQGFAPTTAPIAPQAVAPTSPVSPQGFAPTSPVSPEAVAPATTPISPQGFAPTSPVSPEAVAPASPISPEAGAPVSAEAVAPATTPVSPQGFAPTGGPQAVAPTTTPNAPGFPPLPALQAPAVPLPVATPAPTAGAIAGERLRKAPGSGSAAPGLAPATTTATDPVPAGRSRTGAADAVIPAGADPSAPALSPGAVPAELADRVGATVKELSRDTPFSMVAFTAQDLGGTTTMVRAKQADGSWGPWYATDRVDTRRSDHLAPSADDKTGTEPIYVGTTKAVQVLVTRQPGLAAVDRQAPAPTAGDRAQDGIGVVLPEMHSAPGDYPLAAPGDTVPATHDSAAPDGSDPAIVPNLPEFQRDPASEPLSGTPATADDPARTLAAVLIDPGRGLIDENLSSVATPLPGNGPRVISRAQWGADESLRCSEPTYDDGVSAITVHHTAGRTEYTKAESAGIVRAIYAYHARKLGWCDIGYNALVDKYGQIFEGRAGGLDRAVEGAHAGGFNENTSGVALMGNYGDEAPSEAALQAAGQFIGWRARMAGLDPKGSTTLYSEGTIYSKYDEGEAVRLPIVFAHRDVGNTSCPGDAAYAQMDRIRDIAAAEAAAPSGGTEPANLGVSSNRPPVAAPAPPPGPPIDLKALADLTTKLLGLVNDNIIARYWSGQGGPNGRLGAAASEPRRTSDGGQYARFVNGYVYARPDGQVVEVVGRLMDRFLQLGAESGVLGLPTRNAYAVPDGLRADFQYGSLILNQLTGIVTTLVSYYADVSQRGDQAGAARGQDSPGAAGPAVTPPGNRAPGAPAAPQVPPAVQAPPGANPAWPPGTGSRSGTR
nr:N-acetylmuramoyl-L-alanine amidase [Nocardia sp. BMG111209]